MRHYPEQRYLSRLTTIRREVLLPEQAVGSVEVQESKRVDIRDFVARGALPSRHVILDAVKFFKLRKPEDLETLLQVDVGDFVEEITVVAGKSTTRGQRLYSPIEGRVVRITRGQIIIEETPDLIDLEAGVRGRVTQTISGRGVIVEATGAQIQGVWGNDKRTIATLRMEPDDGVENIYEDQLDMKYLGAIIVIRRQLTPITIEVMDNLGIAGFIAPSMDYETVEAALQAPGPILLTEGFGDARMSRAIYTMLSEFEGQQVTLDAYLPRSWENRRPEVVINRQAREGERPGRPNIMLTLRKDMSVRVTRAPYAGQTGQVMDLPKHPVLLDNGLRAMCAQVALIGGEQVFVPLANLEVLGR